MMKRTLALIAWLVVLSLALPAAWTTKRLTYNPGWSLSPAVAVSGANVYVVWSDDPTMEIAGIYFRKSIDQGVTWQAARMLTASGEWGFTPDIAAEGSNVYVVWEQNDSIFFRKSTDAGASWQAARKVTYTEGGAGEPDIEVNGSNLYLVWQQEPADIWDCKSVHFKKSTDGGATWQASRRLTDEFHDRYSPALAVSGSNVYIVWMDTSYSANYEIVFRRSTDGGATWKYVQRLTQNYGDSKTPAVAASGLSVHVFWSDNDWGNYDIYYRQSVNAGATLAGARRMTKTSGHCSHPASAANGSNLGVAYMGNCYGNSEIFLKKSATGGSGTFSLSRLTYTAGSSGSPAVAISNTSIYVVYTDDTPGNVETYLKYSPL